MGQPLIVGLKQEEANYLSIRVPPPNWYLRWRAERFNLLRFSEKPDHSPPESLLQQVWLFQRVLQEKLQTSDGRSVRVLHPGFLNREAGPDFREAIVQIGHGPAVSGDIEIDIVPAGWEQHSHAGNPAYRNVVLHVTWEPETGRPNLPAVALKHALDSTLPELSFWLGVEPKPAPEGLAGKCSAPLRSLSPSQVAHLLKQAAQARLRRKAEQLQARARQVGWEGALWEGLFSALGYKRNVWPMRHLAELRRILCANLPAEEPLLPIQGRLFGLAGLLPNQPVKSSDRYVEKLWQSWWREAAELRDHVLPLKLWNFAGTRPANHPQRRLALAAHWLVAADLPRKLEDWLGRQIGVPDLLRSINELLQSGDDPFWMRHATFRSAPFRHPQQLLGEQRVTDLAMNVILPWLYVRACAGSNEQLANAAESRYLLWPPGEDNSVLRLARQRLFGGVPADFLKTSAEQQGVIQIVRDFCKHSNAVCQSCLFPELISAAVVCDKRRQNAHYEAL